MSIDHQARDAGDLHAYCTVIPNIVFAKLAAGEITPEDFTLYCVLKKTAGERGASTKATKTLCAETRGSTGGIVASKRRLINAGLIEVETVQRVSGDTLIGGRPQHRVTMTDVWPQNMAMFATGQASSPSEQGSSPHELASSPSATKEDKPSFTYVQDGCTAPVPSAPTPAATRRAGRLVATPRPEAKKPPPHAALVVALLDELGESDLNFARHVRDAKALAVAGKTEDDVRRIVRWLLKTKGEFFATEPLTMTTVRKYADIAPKSAATNLDDRSPETPTGRRRRGPTVLSGVYR